MADACCSSLRDAARRGHADCVRRLREGGTEPWLPEYVLETAARCGHVAVMSFALEAGAVLTPAVMRCLVNGLLCEGGGGSYAALDFALERERADVPWPPDVAEMCVDARRFTLLEHLLGRRTSPPPMDISMSRARRILFNCCRTPRERRIALAAMDPAFVYWLWNAADLSPVLFEAGQPPPGLTVSEGEVRGYLDKIGANNPRWSQ